MSAGLSRDPLRPRARPCGGARIACAAANDYGIGSHHIGTPPDMTAPVATVAAEGEARERDAFTAAMRHLVGGVSVVTVTSGGERGGLAATSLTSLSADPPSLIVCVKQSSSAMPLLRASGRFGISLLGHDHQHVADRFSGRDGSRGADRFAGAAWIEVDGTLVLADALASFACQVEDIIERFSHAIVIGRVTASRALGGDGALVYWRAAYAKVGF